MGTAMAAGRCVTRPPWIALPVKTTREGLRCVLTAALLNKVCSVFMGSCSRPVKK